MRPATPAGSTRPTWKSSSRVSSQKTMAAMPCSGPGVLVALAGLANAGRAELDADPRARWLGCLGNRVLPGALASAAHYEQVAVPEQVTQRLAAAVARAQPESSRVPERDDRHDGLAYPAA